MEQAWYQAKTVMLLSIVYEVWPVGGAYTTKGKKYYTIYNMWEL